MLNLSRQGMAALLFALSATCAAQQAAPPVSPADAAVTSETAPAAGAQRRGGEVFAAPLAEERLAALRGGSESPWSDMKLNGAVSGNSAVAVASGANVITEGSFSNASGLPMVIQNSGANVLIQNATIINVQFK
ncbi:hypothetical protein [Burkholderia sp. LMU1-1-1.1]|uniref:hypothetical protein n=1 Tax=Burkholderia sp. LMU1-1-1.1 TaxID=3135266 RepID=UPI0034143F82